MKFTKCVELTDEECEAIESAVRIIERLIEAFDPNDSYDSMFCYLIDQMKDGTLPNLIKFD